MKKRALVLSGGGALGAFQVGALGPLARTCDGWDMVCGVSVGAINAAKLCQYPRADHQGAVDELQSLWRRRLNNSSAVYKGWMWGLLDSLFSKGSMYNTEPLHKLLKEELDVGKLRSSGVAFRIGAVSLGRGSYQVLTEANDNLDQWLMASSAFPVAFPSVQIGADKWIDGGIRNITPFTTLLYDHEEVDIVVCQPVDGSVDPWSITRSSSVLEVAARVASIMAGEIARGDFDAAREMLRGKKIRLVAPRHSLQFDPLKFEAKPISLMMEMGRAAAEEVR